MLAQRRRDEQRDYRNHNALLTLGQREQVSHLRYCATGRAYASGSAIPISRNAFKRSWHESHAPQARPSGAGS